MRRFVPVPIFVLVAAAGCGGDGDADGDATAADETGADDGSSSAGDGSTGAEPVMPVLPDVSMTQFVDVIDNPYLPMPVGATWTIESQTDEGLIRIEVEVLAETRTIEGVVATVVQDREYLDDELIEDTKDWFAQDVEGNVWYLGEETCEFEGGMCVDTHGAWEWGVDAALPGIIMRASPTVDGMPYYQEYYLGEAEDYGEVVAVGLSIEVAAGVFEDCIQIHEGSTLDLTLDENKYYCSGVGNVLIEDGEDREELVEYDQP
jgi:hypothetical protein